MRERGYTTQAHNQLRCFTRNRRRKKKIVKWISNVERHMNTQRYIEEEKTVTEEESIRLFYFLLWLAFLVDS